ncbi:Isochorismatase hydrolase [Acephala macrosclerotiorum]|nr:Isochorismatase hydrolase [Acephala macrosclerotiorum]
MSIASDAPVLLLVDIQQGMVEGSSEWGPRSTPNLTTNVEKLLEFWRSKSWPVLHVQHDDIADPTNIINAKYPETYKIHASAAPIKDEPVFVKNVGSAFVATELPTALEKLGTKGKRRVYVAGMDSSQCINSTTRNGSDLGYNITVVSDACAGYGIEDLNGKKVDAQTTHELAISMLQGGAKILTTDEVLRIFVRWF